MLEGLGKGKIGIDVLGTACDTLLLLLVGLDEIKDMGLGQIYHYPHDELPNQTLIFFDMYLTSAFTPYHHQPRNAHEIWRYATSTMSSPARTVMILLELGGAGLRSRLQRPSVEDSPWLCLAQKAANEFLGIFQPYETTIG